MPNFTDESSGFTDSACETLAENSNVSASYWACFIENDNWITDSYGRRGKLMTSALQKCANFLQSAVTASTFLFHWFDYLQFSSYLIFTNFSLYFLQKYQLCNQNSGEFTFSLNFIGINSFTDIASIENAIFLFEILL